MQNADYIDTLTAFSYYPFGMLQPNRQYTATSTANYRFGFNGKERDDEIKGNGNSYDFEARIYDSRIATWLSVDPLQKKYADLSPYLAFGDNPIRNIDPDGKDVIATDKKSQRVVLKATNSAFGKGAFKFDADGKLVLNQDRYNEFSPAQKVLWEHFVSGAVLNHDAEIHVFADNNAHKPDGTIGPLANSTQGDLAEGSITVSKYNDAKDFPDEKNPNAYWSGITVSSFSAKLETDFKINGKNQGDWIGDDVKFWHGLGHFLTNTKYQTIGGNNSTLDAQAFKETVGFTNLYLKAVNATMGVGNTPFLYTGSEHGGSKPENSGADNSILQEQPKGDPYTQHSGLMGPPAP